MGPAGAGKSTVIHTLKAAVNIAGNYNEVHVRISLPHTINSIVYTV